MRYVLLFLLYCEEILAAAPGWVEGVRSGEERFKLQNGTTTIFRQIADTCETAFKRLEQDLEREYQMLVKYTTEIVYEDSLGCAITASVKGNIKVPDIKEAMLKRAQMAQKHAVYGLTYQEFKRFTGDSSPITVNSDASSLCRRSTGSEYESIHGIVTICWKDGVIQAHCVPKAGACWRDAAP